MKFVDAFRLTVGLEGGYVNDPLDPGGETKYGISKRAHPSEDIENLTLERAQEIYYRDYWGPAGCDAVPDLLKWPLFDAAVNHGVHAAIKMLQRAVGEHPDGSLGPLTIQAASSANPYQALARLAAERLRTYTDLPTWRRFGRGWARRVAELLRQ